MFVAALVGFLIGLICSGLVSYVWVGQLSMLVKSATLGASESRLHSSSFKSLNVTNCPGESFTQFQVSLLLRHSN